VSVLRILIVEDNGEKLERISRAIVEVDPALAEGIEHVADLRSARRKLQETRYDLLVLDVVLPVRIDEPPRTDAGLQLLDELARRGEKYHTPSYTIGVTQYEDLYSEAQARFQEHTLSVVQYEAGSDRWVGILQAGVRYVLRATASRANHRPGYDSEAAIVCALNVPELAAVRSLPWNFQLHAVTSDDTPYYQGLIPREGGARTVYAAAAPRMGMQAAAVLAAKMVFHFRPKYLIMAGISAGLRTRTRPGDILAADPCWEWSSSRHRTRSACHPFFGV
jgi:CheY-like chemotaxis protein